MRFRPSLPLTLVLGVLAVLFLRLALWQLDRQAEKQALFDRFENAPAMLIEQAIAQASEFARVDASGNYDVRRQLLLDNRVWQGRAGVHVLNPFMLSDGSSILVDRGWLPLAPDRRSLPAFDTPAGSRSLSGRLSRPPRGGPRLGEADQLVSDHWPQLITYLDVAAASAALDSELQPWILLLDKDDPSGFEDRDWQPSAMAPAVHRAYAVQWAGLCAAAVVIWIVLGFRRGLSARTTA